MALLFHPKKNTKSDTQPPTPKPAAGSPNARRKPLPPPKKEDEDEDLKLPDGPFQEFRLLSSVLNGWKYDVMKFDSRRPVDIFRWTQPIKLNRKDMRRDEGPSNVSPEAVGPMLGTDGKPVMGSDGKIVMVDAEGRPIQANGGAGPSKEKGKAGAGKKRFQRKTRQVFFVPEEVRQLRREERYPWVMEDSSTAQNEVWVGQMEDASKSDTHAFFMPAANDVFKFVPAHRWYKFQKRLKHDLPTDTANVESLVFLTTMYYIRCSYNFRTSTTSTRSVTRRHGWLVARARARHPQQWRCSKLRPRVDPYREARHLSTIVVKV